MKRWLSDYLDDICLLAGCGCILYGLAQWNPVMTWVTGGLMLVGFGVLIGIRKARNASK
jgi:hypothetical protein